MQLEAHVAIASSGPIPDPVTLAAYPPDVQAKIIEWHDRQVKAVFDDASKRDDFAVAKGARLDVLKQWLSFGINLILIGGALIAFVVTGNPNVFWSYTVLGATVVGNVIITINKNRGGDHRDSGRTE